MLLLMFFGLLIEMIYLFGCLIFFNNTQQLLLNHICNFSKSLFLIITNRSDLNADNSSTVDGDLFERKNP